MLLRSSWGRSTGKEARPVTGDPAMKCDLDDEPSLPLSVYEEALQEAERHKWIESQKQGRDLGERAIREWYRVYWPQFCRHKRLEHLEGTCCWREFEHEDFGQLYSLIVAGDLLVDRILDRVYAGCENLEIINWAIQWGLPIDHVINILAQLDVNRARLEPAGL